MYAYGGETLCRACRYPVLAEDERVCEECRRVFDWSVWGHALCPSCYDLYVGDVEYDPGERA